MSGKFGRSMLQTYVSASLGSFISQFAVRGLFGGKGFDIFNIGISGLQNGTTFVAYPIALDVLSRASKKFKENLENPKGNKIVTYLVGGATATTILTLINFPLQRIQVARNSKTTPIDDISFEDVLGFYIDNLGGSIGFAAAMGTLAPLIPITGDSLTKWAKGHILVLASNFVGRICSLPVQSIRYKESTESFIRGFIRSVPGIMVTSDAMTHFKDLCSFLVE